MSQEAIQALYEMNPYLDPSPTFREALQDLVIAAWDAGYERGVDQDFPGPGSPEEWWATIQQKATEE